jgi:methyl coenzyme M reductase beta subunit
VRNTPTGGLLNKWNRALEKTLTVPGVDYLNDTYLGIVFLSNEAYGAPIPGAFYNGTVITGGGLAHSSRP